MGKISEWNRSQLASLAVGAPQQDQSGQIIAQGIQQGIQGVAKIIGERQDAKTDLIASERTASLTTELSKAQVLKAREYRDKPQEYVQAMNDTADQLITSMTKDLDPAASQKFIRAASGIKTSFNSHWNAWAWDRDNEIIVGKIENLYTSATDFAENSISPEAFAQHMKNFDVVNTQARKFLAETTVLQKSKSYTEQAKKGFTANQIVNNNSGFIRDLQNGRYKDILDEKDQKSALYSAMQYRNVRQQTALWQYGITGVAEIDQLQNDILDGKGDFATLNRKIDWAEKNLNVKDKDGVVIVNQAYLDALKETRQLFLMTDKPQAAMIKRSSDEFQKKWTAQWEAFLSGGESKSGRGSYDNILGLYCEAARAYRKGEIDDGTFASIRTTMNKVIKNREGKGQQVDDLMTVTKKAGVSGWFGSLNTEDVFSIGYDMIRRKVDTLSAYDKNQRERMKLDFMAEFTNRVDQLPVETKDALMGKNKQLMKDQAALILEGKDKTPGVYNSLMAVDPVTRATITPGMTKTIPGKGTFVSVLRPDGSVGWQAQSDVTELLGNR